MILKMMNTVLEMRRVNVFSVSLSVGARQLKEPDNGLLTLLKKVVLLCGLFVFHWQTKIKLTGMTSMYVFGQIRWMSFRDFVMYSYYILNRLYIKRIS